MRKFEINEAVLRAEAIRQAETKLSEYLSKCFPVGARCSVTLMAGQKHATPATIMGSEGNRYGGEVCVEIDTAKPNSRLRYRRVSVTQVFDVIEKKIGGVA